MADDGNNSSRSENHHRHLPPQQQAHCSHLALSHVLLARSCPCMWNQTWDPSGGQQCLVLWRGQKEVPGGWWVPHHFPSSVTMHDGCVLDKVKEYLQAAAGSWEERPPPAQEGCRWWNWCPQTSSCPTLWAALDTAPDGCCAFRKTAVFPYTAGLEISQNDAGSLRYPPDT